MIGTSAMPPVSVQIFGLKNCPASRAAERFFKERRVGIHYVDLRQKPMSAGEIRRFIERFTFSALINTAGKPYEDEGLKYIRESEAQTLVRIERQPRLLRLPLVRAGNKLAIGKDEQAWQDMLA